MQDPEYFPRYMVHQLRTHMPASVVGRLVNINPNKRSITIETDNEGTDNNTQPR